MLTWRERKWVFGKNYGIKRSFIICVAAACLVQGEYKVLSLLFIISERDEKCQCLELSEVREGRQEAWFKPRISDVK